MRTILSGVVVATAVGISFLSGVNGNEQAVPLEKLPKAVTEAVKKMFPKGDLLQATQEVEDGHIEYEVTVKENGRRIDVKVEANGKIDELEKEIDLMDLPVAVSKTLEKKYPKAVLQTAEAVFEVEDGEQELEYYEVQVITADNQKIEVKIEADGTLSTLGDEQEAESDD